jgi:hypothetical protein
MENVVAAPIPPIFFPSHSAPDPPDLLSLPLGSERLGAVFQNEQPVSVRDLSEAAHVRRVPEQMDGKDPARSRGDALLDEGRVQVECLGVDVDEDGSGPHAVDRLGGRDERERGGDDLVPGLDAERLKPQYESVGAGAEGDRVGDPQIGGHLRLQRVDVRAEDETPRPENPLHGGLDLVPERVHLGREVEERNLRLHGGR